MTDSTPAVSEALGFVIENRGNVRVMDWSAMGGHGCTPASSAEAAMWDYIADLTRQLAEAQAGLEREQGVREDAQRQLADARRDAERMLALLRDIRPALACEDTYHPCSDLRRRIDAAMSGGTG